MSTIVQTVLGFWSVEMIKKKLGARQAGACYAPTFLITPTDQEPGTVLELCKSSDSVKLLKEGGRSLGV